jgi:hypothetical protein
MALRTLALGVVVCLIGTCECIAQRVGSWRNQPGTNAIAYDSRGRRLFWDDNGQLVGRYDFRANRYEAIDAPPLGVGNSLASTHSHFDPNLAIGPGNEARTPTSLRSLRWPAHVFRGGKLRSQSE